MSDPETSLNLHATCVAWQQRGVLILGASGSGKSSLGLQLMSFGADLVSDDRVDVHVKGGAVLAQPPAPLAGLIEARKVGILQADYIGSCEIQLCVDLDQVEMNRLPKTRTKVICGISLPCLYNPSYPHFAAAVLQVLKAGRRET